MLFEVILLVDEFLRFLHSLLIFNIGRFFKIILVIFKIHVPKHLSIVILLRFISSVQAGYVYELALCLI